MPVLALTYVIELISLILIFMPSKPYLVMLGCISLVFDSIKSIVGEIWVKIDTNNVITITQQDTGFAFVNSMIMFGISIIAFYYAIDTILEMRKKESTTRL